MKKNKKLKLILIIIAAVIIIIFSMIVTNIVKKPINRNNDKNTIIESNSNVRKEQISRPTIEGKENIKISGELKINISQALKQEKIVDNYVISNIELKSDLKGSVITADISTTASEKQQGRDIEIVLIDKNGNELEKFNSYIGQIDLGEKSSFRTETTSDIANIYDLKIKII